jgi:hypothetical protein
MIVLAGSFVPERAVRAGQSYFDAHGVPEIGLSPGLAVLASPEVLPIPLSLLSLLTLAYILHLSIKATSRRFEEVRRETLLEVKAFSSADEVRAETLDDLQHQRPFYAAFCIQYTPREYQHEEKAALKKIGWIVTAKTVQLATICLPFLPNVLKSVNAEWGRSMLTAAGSVSFICINLWYNLHMLRRPYVSHRPSRKMGDPMNDSEILTTRAVSWSAALLTIRDGLTGSGTTRDWISRSGWVMDVICAGVVAGLVISQRPLFRGTLDDLRESTGQFLGRSSSLNSSTDPARRSSSPVTTSPSQARGPRHSGAFDIGSGSQIAMMMRTESFREVLWMQSRLRPKAMREDERERWVWPSDGPRGNSPGSCSSTSCMGRFGRGGTASSRRREEKNVGCGRLVLQKFAFWAFVGLPSLVGYIGVLFGCIISGTTFRWAWWILIILPTVLCIVQDLIMWRSRSMLLLRHAERSQDDSGILLNTKASRGKEALKGGIPEGPSSDEQQAKTAREGPKVGPEVDEHGDKNDDWHVDVEEIIDNPMVVISGLDPVAPGRGMLAQDSL